MRNNLIWYMMGINLEYLGCNRAAQLNADKWKIISLRVKNSIVNECSDAAAGWVRGKKWGVTGEKYGIFSRIGKEGKWVIELLLEGESRGLWSGDGEAKHRLQGEMPLSWTEMPLEGQKSLKKPKIPSWTKAGILGFGAHWHKKSRFIFFSTDTRWKFELIWFRTELRKLQKISKEIPGGVSGGGPHLAAELSWDSLSSRENDLYSSVWLGWRGGRNQGARLRREGSVVTLQRTWGILAIGKTSSASSP